MIVNYYDYSDFDVNDESDDDEPEIELDLDIEFFDDDEPEVRWLEMSHHRYNHSSWEDLMEIENE